MAKKTAAKKVTVKSILAHNKALVGAIVSYFGGLRYRIPVMQFHYNGQSENTDVEIKGGAGKMSVGMANVQNLYHQIQTAQQLGYTVEVTAGSGSEQKVQFKVYKTVEVPEILRNLQV